MSQRHNEFRGKGGEMGLPKKLLLFLIIIGFSNVVSAQVKAPSTLGGETRQQKEIYVCEVSNLIMSGDVSEQPLDYNNPGNYYPVASVYHHELNTILRHILLKPEQFNYDYLKMEKKASDICKKILNGQAKRHCSAKRISKSNIQTYDPYWVLPQFDQLPNRLYINVYDAVSTARLYKQQGYIWGNYGSTQLQRVQLIKELITPEVDPIYLDTASVQPYPVFAEDLSTQTYCHPHGENQVQQY